MSTFYLNVFEIILAINYKLGNYVILITKIFYVFVTLTIYSTNLLKLKFIDKYKYI